MGFHVIIDQKYGNSCLSSIHTNQRLGNEPQLTLKDPLSIS